MKLEDVCYRGSSNLAQKDLVNLDGSYPVYGASGFIKNIDMYHQEKEYIAVVKDGAGIGRTILLPGKSSVIGTLQYLIPKEHIIPKYLYYAVTSMKLAKHFIGSTIPHIYFKDYKKERLPLPSENIQLEVVSVLEKIEKIIFDRKKQVEEYDNLIKSRFVEMFGDPVKNEKRWEINNLGDLGYFKNGMNFNQSDEGYILKFLGVGEFKKLTRIDSVSILSELELSNKPSDEYLLQKGDIVFVRSNGSKELVGRSVLIGELEEPATYSGFCIRFRNQNQKIQPDFLIRLFADDNFKKTFKQDSRGANINNLNQTMLSGLRIIVPPIELQNRFTAFVQVTDKLKFEV